MPPKGILLLEKKMDNERDSGNVCRLWRMWRQESTNPQKSKTRISS